MGFFDSESETNTTIPEDAKEFRNTVFGNAKKVTNRDFPEFNPRDRVSPFTNDQTASFQMARNTTGSTQPFSESALNATAARQDPETRTRLIGDTPTASAAKIGQAPQGSAATVGDVEDVSTAQIRNTPSATATTIDPSAVTQVGGNTINPGATEDINAQTIEAKTFPEADLDQYMNPYIDKVVDETSQEMQRNLDIAQNKQMQDFAAAGAFGGARQAIAQSENIRNFADKIGQETARLRSQGFRRAQDQIAQDQNRELEAARSNQRADLEAAQANQQTDLETRLANQQAGLEADIANQQTGLEARLSNQAAQNQMAQFNTGLEMDTRRRNQAAQNQMARFNTSQDVRTRLSDQQALNSMEQMNTQLSMDQRARDQAALNETSQFNAQLGMEGQLADQQARNNMNQFNQRLGLAASDQLSNLASREQQRQQQDIGFLNEMGRQQQQQDQRLRNAAYQEFQRRVAWPERQLGLRSDVLAGAPIGRTQQTTNSPSGASYIGGAASLLGGADDIIGGIESIGDFIGF